MNDLINRVIDEIGSISPIGNALLHHLIEPHDQDILNALSTYQNSDGGFGHGLEADIQMPLSNVASTDVAVSVLEHVADSPLKQEMIQQIIRYYESVYDPHTFSFPIAPKEVDDYPHAIWWNSDGLDGFTYGNPNPEVLGFLLQYKRYVKTIDLNALTTHMVQYIKTSMTDEVSMHSVLSLLHLYKRGDEILRQSIHEYVLTFLHQFVELDPTRWSEYCLEPYKAYSIVPELFHGMEEAVEENINKYETLLQHTIVRPNWDWNQYPDVFEKVKDDWTPFIQFDILRAIKLWREQ